MNLKIIIPIVLLFIQIQSVSAEENSTNLVSRAKLTDSTNVAWNNSSNYSIMLKPLEGLLFTKTLSVFDDIGEKWTAVEKEKNYEEEKFNMKANSIIDVITDNPSNFLSIIFPIFLIIYLLWLFNQFNQVIIEKIEIPTPTKTAKTGE